MFSKNKRPLDNIGGVLRATLYSGTNVTPVALAQGQLEAYNRRDLDAFCRYFAEDIVLIDGHNNDIILSGMTAFREKYTQTFSNTGLHCHLVSRMELDNIVIDRESVEGFGEERVEAIAIYHTHDDAISKVIFY